MTPLLMIAEWRRGCTCMTADDPWTCRECTVGLINHLEAALRAPAPAPDITFTSKTFHFAVTKKAWARPHKGDHFDVGAEGLGAGALRPGRYQVSAEPVEIMNGWSLTVESLAKYEFTDSRDSPGTASDAPA